MLVIPLQIANRGKPLTKPPFGALPLNEEEDAPTTLRLEQ